MLIRRSCYHHISQKNFPRQRPIGVGEVLRRIAGKVIVSHLKEDVIQSVGSLQVCAGQDAGCESLIHAMRTIYEDQSAEAVLLVDASNAFNSTGMYFSTMLRLYIHQLHGMLKIVIPLILNYL